MVMVVEQKCAGCGLCVAICPREAITALAYAQIDSQKCTDCFGGIHYFEGNVSLTDRQATLDLTQTYWIRKCFDCCPTGAIIEVEE